MIRLKRTWGMVLIGLGLLGSVGGVARAGEEDDLQRQIDTQKASVADLERLDELKAVTDEIARLKSWLDEAWGLRAKHEYDQVREVLDRTLKQADLIRAEITVSKLRAQELKREASLKEVKDKIAKTRKTLQETSDKKKALEKAAQ
jgi:predicted  nucleic acid-binding Zn-ribbon protein